MNTADIEKLEVWVANLVFKTERVELDGHGTCLRCQFKDGTHARFIDLEQAQWFIDEYLRPQFLTMDMELTKDGWVASVYNNEGCRLHQTNDYVTEEKAYDAAMAWHSQRCDIDQKRYQIVPELQVLNSLRPAVSAADE